MPKKDKNIEVKEITDGEFEEVIKKNSAVAVDFYAEWCMPCLMQAPIIDDIAKAYAKKIIFFKINIDENKKIAAKYKVMSIPTLLIFKNAQFVDRIVGTISYEMLNERLKKLL